MATETLQCENGDHEWSREVKRGRKPSSCPDHPQKVKTTPKVSPEQKVKEIEAKFQKHRHTRPGEFEPLGDPIRVNQVGLDQELTVYSGFRTSNMTVTKGDHVKEKGDRSKNLYRFLAVLVRKDGSAYTKLIGVSGPYHGRIRIIGVTRIEKGF